MEFRWIADVEREQRLEVEEHLLSGRLGRTYDKVKERHRGKNHAEMEDILSAQWCGETLKELERRAISGICFGDCGELTCYTTLYDTWAAF